MKRTFMVLATGLVAVAILAGRAAVRAEKAVEPEECVPLAVSWDAAVEEAKLLNVPIVVHSHGFYCGPCWGLHSSLMCNKKYIEFAKDHTVEVIALQRLQEGIDEGSPRARTYKGMRRGEAVDLMAEFPGLTAKEMVALASSRAGTYNDTGGIPFTCIVDPHSLAEIQRWKGGGVSAKTLMEAVEAARKTLESEHGDGVSPKTYRRVVEAEEEAWEEVAEDDYAKGLKILEKARGKLEEDASEILRARLAAAETAILARAEKQLGDVESRVSSDPAEAKKDLRKLLSKLKGTPLEDKAKSLLERI